MVTYRPGIDQSQHAKSVSHIIKYIIVLQLYCISLYCIVLYFTSLYFTVLYCILLYFVLLYGISLYCIVFHCIVWHFIVLYCISLYCMAFHCIVLYFIVLYCIVSCITVCRRQEVSCLTDWQLAVGSIEVRRTLARVPTHPLDALAAIFTRVWYTESRLGSCKI